MIPSDTISNGALSLLQDAEGNHCSSFPTSLLQLIHEAAQKPDRISSLEHPSARVTRAVQIRSLLESGRAFDPSAWAADVQRRSPTPDLESRIHIASAHQAATQIYLLRIMFVDDMPQQIERELESLVKEIQSQLSKISPSSPLIAATAWPAFIAAAEAHDSISESWAQNHFQNIWTAQPWGLIKAALAILRMIWARRKQHEFYEGVSLAADKTQDLNWIAYMERRGVDWLIV